MSFFKVHAETLMKQLKNQGSSLDYLEHNLIEFDVFCDRHYPEAKTLTRDIAESWIDSSNTKSKQQLDKQVRTMKRLGVYLTKLEISSYIPQYRIKSDPTKPISLLTDDELKLFFETVDSINFAKGIPNREHILPVLFRLIYSCG